ncbi:MAG: NfeD family protein [Bacteroidales bacterium]|nr:NfeD family protein [Bacteroidales bacterium]
MSDLNSFFTAPVTWFFIGLVLLLLELVLPGFVIIFFGAGAWITAAACLFFDIGINTQVIIFIIASVTLLLLTRKYIRNKFFTEKTAHSDELEEEFVGKTAVVEVSIKKGYPGKVSFKGTTWTAMSDETIEKGQLAEITGKESINLIVKPIN